MSRYNEPDAESKLMSALANLVWIIPFLSLIELLVRLQTNTLSTWTASPFIGILQYLITAVVIIKIINVIDSQIDKYREDQKKS